LERRSPRQCPCGALVVQRGKRINQNLRLTADQSALFSRTLKHRRLRARVCRLCAEACVKRRCALKCAIRVGPICANASSSDAGLAGWGTQREEEDPELKELRSSDLESVGSRLDIRWATYSLDYFLRMARWIVQMKSAIRTVVVETDYSHRATRLSSRAILASWTDQQVVLRTRHPGVLPSRRTRHGWRKVRLAGDLLDQQHFSLMPSHLVVWLSSHILGVNRGVFRKSSDTHNTIPALP
jgi:hypothetical protein